MPAKLTPTVVRRTAAPDTTPSAMSAREGATKVVQALFDHGAKLNIRDYGNTDNRGGKLAVHTWEPVDYADGLVRVPAELSDEEAATLTCAPLTAWNALNDSPHRPAPGATLLVQGSGGVSLFAAQLGRVQGLRVIATSSSPHKAERLRALGIDHVVDTRQHPDWQQEILRVTAGEGVDHVIDVRYDEETGCSVVTQLEPGKFDAELFEVAEVGE